VSVSVQKQSRKWTPWNCAPPGWCLGAHSINRGANPLGAGLTRRAPQPLPPLAGRLRVDEEMPAPRDAGRYRTSRLRSASTQAGPTDTARAAKRTSQTHWVLTESDLVVKLFLSIAPLHRSALS